jgi:hypothetical protein
MAVGNWVTDLKYRPIPFDLLYLSIKDSPRIIGGWWTGRKWNGLRLKTTHQVIAWKRQMYDYAFS